MKEEEKDILALLLLGGAGIGGYYLYKYLKEKPEDVKKGFNISRFRIFPLKPKTGEEVKITVLGKNNTEEGDCYCRLINLDTQQEVFYDHAIVGKGGIKSFDYITIISNELKLRAETGKIIEGEEELHSYQEKTFKSFPSAEIKSTSFSQLLN